VGKDRSVGAKLNVVQIVSHEVGLACTSFKFAVALGNIFVCICIVFYFYVGVSRVTYNVFRLGDVADFSTKVQ